MTATPHRLRASGFALALLLALPSGTLAAAPTLNGSPAAVEAPATTRAPASVPALFQEGLDLSDARSGLDSASDARVDFTKIHELWVRVRVRTLVPVAMVEVKLYSPRGVAAYVTHAAFSANPATQSVTPEGAAHPVSVHTAQARPGGYALDLSIPVAGTVLTRYLETGTWQVMASVEGRAGSLSKPMEVFIAAK